MADLHVYQIRTLLNDYIRKKCLLKWNKVYQNRVGRVLIS